MLQGETYFGGIWLEEKEVKFNQLRKVEEEFLRNNSRNSLHDEIRRQDTSETEKADSEDGSKRISKESWQPEEQFCAQHNANAPEERIIPQAQKSLIRIARCKMG